MNVRETETTGILINSLICIFRILIQTDHVQTVYINSTETSSDFFYFLSVTLQIYIDCTQTSISHNQIINFMTVSGTLSE